MNARWEMTKEVNGYEAAKLPDLKLGDIFLFEGEADDDQGHLVTDIYTLKYRRDIVTVQYQPEWTPVCNEGFFHYGTQKFRIKNKKK